MRESIEKALKGAPHLFNISEAELFKRLKDHEELPEDEIEIIRGKFWIEYARVQSHGLKEMTMTMIYSGVCSRDLFLSICDDPYKLAWILCPPKDYSAGLNALIAYGYQFFFRTMRADEVDSLGKRDYKLCDLKFKIHQHVEMVKDGMLVRKPAQTGITINNKVTVDSQSRELTARSVADNDVEAKKKYLAELNERERIIDAQSPSKELPNPAIVDMNIETE